MGASHSSPEPLALYALFLNFQRKRRLIALAAGTSEEEAGASLGYVEEAVLRVLDQDGDRNVKELSALIGVERSWMSRVVTSLTERELVNSFTPASDKRSKRIQITATGKRALRALEEAVRTIISGALSDLREDQIARLAECLDAYASALGASPARIGRHSHPVHVQLNRISRVLGVFGNNVMGSGLHLSQVHVLERVPSADKEGISVTDLDAAIPLDVSTISRSVSSLVKGGFLKKTPSRKDKRSVVLSLSKKGETERTRYHGLVSRVFGAALEGMEEREAEDLFALLDLATRNIPIKARGNTDFEIRSVTMDSSPPAVRSLLEKAAQPGSAVGDFTDHLVVFRSDEPVLVCLMHRDGSNGSVQKLIIEGPSPTKELCTAVLDHCFRE